MSLIPDGTGIHRTGRHKWKTIRYALDDTRRTIRLCAILLVMSLTCATPFLIMVLALGKADTATSRLQVAAASALPWDTMDSTSGAGMTSEAAR